MSARRPIERAPTSAPVRRSTSSASFSSSAKRRPATVKSAPARGCVKLATRSTRAGAISIPMVLPAPAPGGQTTRLTPSLRAACQAWTGPAPPVASRAYSEGMRRRSAMATRAAPAMLSFTAQRELGRGAAHVEGQHGMEAGVAPEPGTGQRAGGGAAFQQLHRSALGFADMRQAAVGQHQEEATRNALGAQRLLEPLEI